MSKFELIAGEYERLSDAMSAHTGNTESVINEVLHTEAAELISDEIQSLLPISGRTWKGKRQAAHQAHPFSQENGNLSVTIKTKSSYNYLYFPDDGSNTKRHAGNQQFMMRGTENKTSEIIDRCITSLVKNFEED